MKPTAYLNPRAGNPWASLHVRLVGGRSRVNDPLGRPSRVVHADPRPQHWLGQQSRCRRPGHHDAGHDRTVTRSGGRPNWWVVRPSPSPSVRRRPAARRLTLSAPAQGKGRQRIPPTYLRASERQRRELLAGLLGTRPAHRPTDRGELSFARLWARGRRSGARPEPGLSRHLVDRARARIRALTSSPSTLRRIVPSPASVRSLRYRSAACRSTTPTTPTCAPGR